MTVGEFLKRKEKLSKAQKQLVIAKRASEPKRTMFTRMKELLSNQGDVRSRATARAAARARLRFAQAARDE